MNKKIIIYQVLPRLFGNCNVSHIENGTITENGVGKMNDFDSDVLKRIHSLGANYVWYTGIIRHATTTDYTKYGIPKQHAAIVKGRAGSPYAITDYYDVDPDIAVNVSERMSEWENLISRTHEADMKVIIDFVPNHVARQYHSITKPANVIDLGENDDNTKSFDVNNNFYYCPDKEFLPQIDLKCDEPEPYYEMPAKATGNDRFDNSPLQNDWYETIKLNYGIDYCNCAGKSSHFDPIPNTWKKMTDILLFWAEKGIDGFRCDMAEMVPVEFWSYATKIVKTNYPNIIFIGEVYDPSQYRSYINGGFNYLYDKVGMYDCLRGVVRGEVPATQITSMWQSVDDINDHMLYFLENHDEQRIASDFFCGDANKALPALIVSALLIHQPFMIYFGQEFGERGMDKEGFSGIDGRTTIFDYWSVDTLRRGYFNKGRKVSNENKLFHKYQHILKLSTEEKAISEGDFFDLMYVNPASDKFNPSCHYAFMRKYDDEILLIVVNFSGDSSNVSVTIPDHAFDFFNIPEQMVTAESLFTGEKTEIDLKKNGSITTTIMPYYGEILKFKVVMKEKELVFNEHNKDEFPPAHTAEHLLNQVMVRMFGCERSRNAHIERKKSKISYILDHKPDRNEEKAIEAEMNKLIDQDLPVTYEFATRDNIPEGVNIDRLPDDASEAIRLVRIGDFDICPCIGKHVRSTSQIGKFVLLGTNWEQESHSFRIRFKVV